MDTVGIRALKQNASAVVASAAAGETVWITDRGRLVAQLSPIARTPLQQLVESGRARRPQRALADLTPPAPGPALGAELEAMRAAERF